MGKQLLIAVVLVGGLLAAFVFLTEPPPVHDQNVSWRMPDISSLDGVVIIRDETTIRLNRDASGWRLTEPLEFSASDTEVAHLERLFANPQARLVVNDRTAVSDEALARHGFERDVIEVALFDTGGELARIRIGSTEDTRSGGRSTWVWPVGADTLYRLNQDVRQVVDQGLARWRDKDVLVFTEAQRAALSAVEVRYDGQMMRFSRESAAGDNWLIEAPSLAALDLELVQRYVGRVDTLRAVDFADEVTVEAADLTTPAHVVIFEIANERFELRFGRPFIEQRDEGEGEERRYVQLNDGPIFQIRERSAQVYMKRIGDLRNRDIGQVDPDQVTHIVLQEADSVDANGETVAGLTIELERVIPEPEDPPEDPGNTNGDAEVEHAWRMTSPEPIGAVEMTVMRRLLSNTAEIRAQRYADHDIGGGVAGLEPAQRVITVRLADETEHSFEIGGPVAQPTAEQTLGDLDHYARYDSGDIFELRAFKVRDLLIGVAELTPAEVVEP